jgi:hypothetical protein
LSLFQCAYRCKAGAKVGQEFYFPKLFETFFSSILTRLSEDSQFQHNRVKKKYKKKLHDFIPYLRQRLKGRINLN